jgi:hypothetical protein
MSEAKQQDIKQKEKLSFFDLMTEIFGWLQIVASSLLIGVAVGFIIYILKPGKPGLIIAISVAALGLIVGIILATRIWKKKGTVHFVSRVTATSELDNLDKNEE